MLMGNSNGNCFAYFGKVALLSQPNLQKACKKDATLVTWYGIGHSDANVGYTLVSDGAIDNRL
jgi:hypothetical protein